MYKKTHSATLTNYTLTQHTADEKAYKEVGRGKHKALLI